MVAGAGSVVKRFDVASVLMFIVGAGFLAFVFYLAMTHRWTGADTLPEVRISAELPGPPVAVPSASLPSPTRSSWTRPDGSGNQ
jgi:hypothetical protein